MNYYLLTIRTIDYEKHFTDTTLPLPPYTLGCIDAIQTKHFVEITIPKTVNIPLKYFKSTAYPMQPVVWTSGSQSEPSCPQVSSG